MDKPERVEHFDKCFVDAVNRYLDLRENDLSQNIELDAEILKEVTALYRVVQYLRTEDAIKPLPGTLKRMIYMKRHISHAVMAESSSRAKYSIKTPNFR